MLDAVLLLFYFTHMKLLTTVWTSWPNSWVHVKLNEVLKYQLALHNKTMWILRSDM